MLRRSAVASVALALGTVALAGAGGCSSSSSSSGSSSPCSNVAISRFQELEIVDPAVVTGSRAMNASDGAWSFRYAVEQMAPQGVDPGQFVDNWFTEWSTLSTFNTYPLYTEPRSSMDQFILCPWAQATASNGCDSGCTCTVNPPKLDLSVAPFRLLAVVNRMDLRQTAGIPPLGEGRLVFGLTNGPGDDPSSAPMPMTIIFEYHLQPVMTLQGWAEAWHGLGSSTAFDEAYLSALQKITDTFVKGGADPSAPNGSALGQARTNESVTNWIWQLRQFGIGGSDGGMHSHTVTNTPYASFNGSASLSQFIQSNATAIENNNFLIPDTMLGGSTDQLQYRWQFPGLSDDLVSAFASNTCNGCHSEGINPSIDVAFHISPLRAVGADGTGRLSTFLNNPGDIAHDELTRRGTVAQSALCGGP